MFQDVNRTLDNLVIMLNQVVETPRTSVHSRFQSLYETIIDIASERNLGIGENLKPVLGQRIDYLMARAESQSPETAEGYVGEAEVYAARLDRDISAQTRPILERAMHQYLGESRLREYDLRGKIRDISNGHETIEIGSEFDDARKKVEAALRLADKLEIDANIELKDGLRNAAKRFIGFAELVAARDPVLANESRAYGNYLNQCYSLCLTTSK